MAETGVGSFDERQFSKAFNLSGTLYIILTPFPTDISIDLSIQST